MVDDFEALSHLTLSRSKRSAWFGGVGTVLKHIFGTVDEEDAIRYDNAIQSVTRDQNNLAKIMKENILVTSSTISTFQKAMNKMSINEQTLNNAVESISATLKNLTSVSNEMYTKSKFVELLNMLENSLLTLSFKVEDTINSVLFSKNNVLHPNVISPKQLYLDLVDNYRLLPNYQSFPVPLDLSHIHIIINISEMISYFNDNKIIFLLKIPLVSTQEFNFYHSLPLPVAHDASASKTYVTIIPSGSYIGITKDKGHYCKINNVVNCKIIENQFFLCPSTNIYSSTANPSCESEMLSKVLTSVPSQCETRFIQGNIEIWQQLNNGKWIFVISQKSQISIDCPKEDIYETNIIGTGMLNIPADCTGYCKETHLVPKKDNKINVKPFRPDFNLINDSCCNNAKFEELKSNVPITKIKNVNLESLRESKNLVKELDYIIDKPHIIEYGQYYSFTTIFIVICIISLISYKIYRCHGWRKYLFKKQPNKEPVETSSDIESVILSIPSPRIRTNVS